MYSIQNLASKPAESTITVKVQVLQLLLIELIVSVWPCKIIQIMISFEKIIRLYTPTFILVYRIFYLSDPKFFLKLNNVDINIIRQRQLSCASYVVIDKMSRLYFKWNGKTEL